MLAFIWFYLFLGLWCCKYNSYSQTHVYQHVILGIIN
jgi:hypothetical protein